jgi:RimJ/RimL family protein N-acetyltransferase
MDLLTPVTLTGQCAELLPLAQSHHDPLIDAVRDGELWKLWYTSVPSPEKMGKDIDFRLHNQRQGTMLPFVVRRLSDKRIVGATTYCHIEPAHKRLEIGYTYYARSVQRTAINSECKLMLLTHAFETLGCIAVEFRTHYFNAQSRAAIERLGAKLDGVLRSHVIMPDGSLRDTCVYSLLSHEWPTARNNLLFKLGRR